MSNRKIQILRMRLISMENGCRAKCGLIALMILFFFMPSYLSEILSGENESPTDYIIILDASSSMNNEIYASNSDFISCDSEMMSLAENRKKCKKIEIAKTNVKCFLDHYAKRGDRISLIILNKDPEEIDVLEFVAFEQREDIYSMIDSIGRGNYETSPILEAMFKAVELYHRESNPESRHKMLIVTDFDFLRDSDEFCSDIKDLRLRIGYLGEGMKIDSIIFFGLIDEKKWELVREANNCFHECLPIATVIDIPSTNLTFDILNQIEDIKVDIPTLLKENMEKDNTIGELTAKLDNSNGYIPRQNWLDFLESLRFPIEILFFICMFLMITILGFLKEGTT
jgi:hypothetical protein